MAAGCAEFDHPFVQALGMFLGEAMCMLAFKVRGERICIELMTSDRKLKASSEGSK